MQTELEYLLQVSHVLNVIDKTPDLDRKENMKRYLHSKVYPQMPQYGFRSITEVRKSVDCLNAGTPDPSKETRYKKVRSMIEVMTGHLNEYEKSRTPGKTFTGLSLHYNREQKSGKNDPEKDRE